MKTLLIFSFALAAAFTGIARGKSSPNKSLTEHKWYIRSQAFVSHDSASTYVDTVFGNEGDYINFQPNKKAYCYFKGIHDTLEYKLIGKDSISFGDTPFVIIISNDKVELYQNELEKNGDYNSVRYTLTDERKYISKTITKK